jgi:hypothetical protein
MSTQKPFEQTDLFGQPIPRQGEATQAPLQALRVTAAHTGRKLSPAQQSFNKLLSRIHNVTVMLQELDVRVNKFQAPHQQAMAALQKQADLQLKAMLLLLHGHLQTRHVTKAQRRDLSELVAGLLLQAEHLQDPDLLALMDQYYSQAEQAQWSADDEEDIQALRNLVRATFAADEQPDLPDDPDALMSLLMQRTALNAARDGAPQEAQAKPARRSRRKNTRQQQAAEQAEQEQLDAKATMRTLYRQLASALHPDRESDPQERARKTELMSQANAAYERQDLATLLKLQLQTTALDAEAISRMADEKIRAMSTLLKQQLATLEAELRQSEHRASHSLGILVSAKYGDQVIKRQLQMQQEDLEHSLKLMQADLDRLSDPTEIKDWLKKQRRMLKQQAVMEEWLDDEPW